MSPPLPAPSAAAQSAPPSTSLSRAAAPGLSTAAAIAQPLPTSAPATISLTSTPVKRKSTAIGVDGPNQSQQSTSTSRLSSGKKPRLASDVTPLIRDELNRCLYMFPNLVPDMILQGPWAIDDVQADSILAKTMRKDICPGLIFDASTHEYTCTPPSYKDSSFSDWLCLLGNEIADISVPSPHPRGTWVNSKNAVLSGCRNGRILPDFVLSAGQGWRSVLVVGEHQSGRASPEVGRIQLACYAEQVFIAQPFRNAVWGIWTSKTSPDMVVWRFDRAGGIGVSMDFGSTKKDLRLVVRCLYAFNNMSPEALGFHTIDISWDAPGYPLDEDSRIMTRIHPHNEPSSADSPNPPTISLESLLFVAPGIVTRGTRVWKGRLCEASGSETLVALKYSWRSTTRIPEGVLYALARSRGAVGLANPISYDSYDDIHKGLRGYHHPCPSSPTKEDNYSEHITSHNRIYTRLILAHAGTPISSHKLSALSIARSLLAAAIGHASLYFDAQILHRDLSPNNIISYSHPIQISPTSHAVCQPGTQVYGSLIDLDYAIDTTSSGSCGAADRTGTYPFIAINVLRGREPHRYRHDIESLLYVLLWVACYPPPLATAPVPKPTSLWDPTNPLGVWVSEPETDVASHKALHIVYDEADFEDLLSCFRPGFGEAYKDASRRMRLALWATAEDSTECKVFTEAESEGFRIARKGRKIQVPKRIGAEDLRLGLGNWEGYLEVREILEDLVKEVEAEEKAALQ
ncbi:hypothetical protein EV426DRAFT_626246 [Tirmania nivea]|nr:hypothetical protein EV426DRAFT_626246 [Tirmania nivea]